METRLVSIGQVKPNENNPRIIKDYKFKKLVKSIQDFPQMLQLRPIVVNEDNVVLGGNMRLKACKEAGLKEVYIIQAKDLTEEQQKEFIVKDNVGFGEWDWDVLANEWDNTQLDEWGFILPNWSEGLEVNNMELSSETMQEEFDPIGNSDGKQRVVFLFDSSEDANSYLNSLNVEYKKQGQAWQVDLSTQFI